MASPGFGDMTARQFEFVRKYFPEKGVASFHLGDYSVVI
jgi:hypothetical protein